MKKLFTLLLLATLSLSAFSVSITFKVSMKGSGQTDFDSVFVVGKSLDNPEGADWQFLYMTPEADSIYSITLNMTKGDTAVYYFILINSWDSYLDYRETVPLDCDQSMELVAWEGDRGFIVPDAPATYGYYWGTCTELPSGPSVIKNISVNQNLGLFPNPAHGEVTVQIPEFAGYASVELLDITGKSVRTFDALNSTIVMSVAGVANGLYMVKVSNGNTTSIGKLVIK